MYQCTLNVCDKQVNQSLTVSFVYLPPQANSESIRQIKTLIKNVKPEVLIGDFNSRVASHQLSDLPRNSKDMLINSQGKKIIEIFSGYFICNGAMEGDEFGEFTFNNTNGSSVLDICLVQPDILNYINKFEVLDTPLSHHCPIKLEIGYCKPPENTYIKKIKWRPELSQNFNNYMHENQYNIVDTDYASFVTAIFKSAQMSGLRTNTTIYTNSKPSVLWMDSELKKAKRKYRYLVKQFRNHSQTSDITAFIESKNSMLIAKKQYLDMSAEKRRNYFVGVSNSIIKSKDSKNFWTSVNLYRNQKNKGNMQYGNISLSNWRNHFQSIFNDQEVGENVNTINANSNEHTQLLVPELDSDFTMFELVLAIKKLSKNKAPGSDGIPNEIWKALNTTVKFKLLNLFNNIFNNPNNMPDTWSEIVIVPIFKKGNPDLPSNYRPISLLNTVTKLFTTLLTHRLDLWCTKNNVLSEFQAGFKKGTGCVEQAFVLNTLIQNQLRFKRSKLFCLFLDLSSAFDLVSHDLLWSRLQKKGVSDKFVSVIKSLYNKANAKIRIAGHYSNNLNITRSVLQGESLSPKLFSLFVDDIVNVVNKSGYTGIRIGQHNVHILLFADDIALIGVTAEELQVKINLVRLYFQESKMKVNLTKTKVVVFRRNKKLGCFHFKWGNEKIEIVDSYVYLGIPFHFSGKFESAANFFLQKAQKALDAVMTVLWKGKIGNFNIQERLFNSICQSVLFYGIAIWGVTNIDKIMIFQNKFIRKLFYLSNETSRYFLILETNAKPIENNFLSVLLKFMNRISNKGSSSLVRNCYEKQYDMCQTGAKKCNWILDVNKLMREWKVPELTKSLHRVKALRNVRKIVSNHLNLCKNDIVRTMLKSRSQYGSCKTHVRNSKYLNSCLSFTNKRLFIQFRSNKNYVFYKKNCDLKGSRANNFENCEQCNLSEKESVYHIFCRCPHYKAIRNSLSEILECKLNYINEETFYKLLFDIETQTDKINELCNAWKMCMKIRSFISNY